MSTNNKNPKTRQQERLRKTVLLRTLLRGMIRVHITNIIVGIATSPSVIDDMVGI